MGRDVSKQVPSLVAQVRKHASASVSELHAGAEAALGVLATALAQASALAPFHVLQQDALLYGAAMDTQFGRLADGLSRKMSLTLGVIEAPTRAEWDRELKRQVALHAHYTAGWLEGGGVPAVLSNTLQPSEYRDATALHAVLSAGLAFVCERLEAALGEWLDAVETELVSLGGGTPALPPQRPPSPRAPLGPSRAERLRALAAQAKALGVRIRKVPADPSHRYLDKLETRLRSVVKDRSRDAATADIRQTRLRELLAFAETLRVRVKSSPADPSDAWLDKMEAKLNEVASRKGEPPFGAPPALPAAPSARRDPPRRGTPRREPPRNREEVARRNRLAAIRAQAGALGCNLGKVPDDPSTEWLDRAERTVASSRTAAATRGPIDSAPALLNSTSTATTAASLILDEGTVQEQIWPVVAEGLAIGRSRENAVQIRNDPGVSRRHAFLSVRAGSHYLEDLSSTKGTLIDDETIASSTRLYGGERIQIGDTVFVFRA